MYADSHSSCVSNTVFSQNKINISKRVSFPQVNTRCDTKPHNRRLVTGFLNSTLMLPLLGKNKPIQLFPIEPQVQFKDVCLYLVSWPPEPVDAQVVSPFFSPLI